MTTMTLAELKRDMSRFLEFKRAMGHPYLRGEFTLKSLWRFTQSRIRPRGGNSRSRLQLEEIVKTWLSRPGDRKPNSISAELSAVRQLCLHRRRRDPDAFVPDQDWAPQSRSPFRPYIFSKREVSRLLKAADAYRHANVGPLLMRTLILILYCTGLRFGEAVRLQLKDVDLSQHLFFVRESKGRSRYVPFGDDLAREIRRWIDERQRIARNHDVTVGDAMLLRDDGRALDVKRAGEALTRLVRLVGLKPVRGRTGPRPYDWRHTYAVHRLTEWYRQGVDIHARLPWLSAYMGHLNILGTSLYLNATPELLRLASERLKKRLDLVENRS